MLSLVAAVVGHQEHYMDDGARQLATLMARSQAQALELGLPNGATTLDLSALGEQRTNAEQLLSLQALLADVGDVGLATYTITDRDSIVLLSLNPREIGTLAPPPANVTEAVARSERENELWRIHSLRARFTIALTLIIVLLVVSLEIATLPIQRRHVEKTLLDGTAATVEWLGEMMSEALGQENFSPSNLGAELSLDQMLATTGTLDWAELQALRIRKNITSRTLCSQPRPRGACAGTYSFTDP